MNRNLLQFLVSLCLFIYCFNYLFIPVNAIYNNFIDDEVINTLGSSNIIPDYLKLDFGPDAPAIPPTAIRGIIIDAGSAGTRLHIFKWQQRIFSTIPIPLTYPTSDEKWTMRMKPGIATFYDSLNLIEDHLKPLLDFAKQELDKFENEFNTYPIFFKATGGMRQLSHSDREAVLNVVRVLLSNKKFNPFYFRNDFARVISGEEEAIYSWCATNFLLGTLIPSSSGTGTVVSPKATYGTVDLGGSSTQIAFFAPDQDILEGLFKLQIGSQKHWNVFTKSFLGFGINSARDRYVQSVIDKSNHTTPIASCLHVGYVEDKYGPLIHTLETVKDNQFELCLDELRPLLYLANSEDTYCQSVYPGECGLVDAYQPELVGTFVGTSSYTYPWQLLMLPETASLELLKVKATEICKMDYLQLLHFFETQKIKDKLSEYIPHACLISSYTYILLTEGYGFKSHHNLTVLDEVNGNKVSWTLGAILYEINALPWGYVGETISKEDEYIIFFTGFIGALIGGFLVFVFMRIASVKKSYETEGSESELHCINIQSINSNSSNDACSTQQKSIWRSQIFQFYPFNSKSLYQTIPDKEISPKLNNLA